jgi:hypothetical protein
MCICCCENMFTELFSSSGRLFLFIKNLLPSNGRFIACFEAVAWTRMLFQTRCLATTVSLAPQFFLCVNMPLTRRCMGSGCLETQKICHSIENDYRCARMTAECILLYTVFVCTKVRIRESIIRYVFVLILQHCMTNCTCGSVFIPLRLL